MRRPYRLIETCATAGGLTAGVEHLTVSTYASAGAAIRAGQEELRRCPWRMLHVSGPGGRREVPVRSIDGVTDVAFDDARDIGLISNRLHPLDVGFSLIGERVLVALVPEPDGSLLVSYADRHGDRRVMSGSADAVVARLRRLGYQIKWEDLP